jgi:hypothetical protein
MRALAAVLVAIAALSLVLVGKRLPKSGTPTSPPTAVAGYLITSAGPWTVITPEGPKKLEISASHTPGTATIKNSAKQHTSGSISVSISSTISLSMSLSSPADPWFVFVESPSRFWFFDGKDEMDYLILTPGRGTKAGGSIHWGRLSSSSEPVPKELIPHLPADLRSLFPEVEDHGKRPSI